MSLSTSFPDQKDDDEAGLTFCRDDDGIMDNNEWVTLVGNGDWVIKKMWIYYDDWKYTDKVRLYIYGKFAEGLDPNSYSHEIFIDGQSVIKFRSSDNFNRDAFMWTFFEIDKEYLTPNSCVEIKIEKIIGNGWEHLLIGYDDSFDLPAGNPNTFQDFGRSWTDNQAGQNDPWNHFNGELMMYLEFAKIDESKSIKHDGQPGQFSVEIQEKRNPPSDFADALGLWIDWSSFSVAEFNSIYKVRLYIYAKATGNIDTSVENMEIWVNDYAGDDGRVITFNPAEHFNDHKWYWGYFEIYNCEDKWNWLFKGLNVIYIVDTDTDTSKNNLQVATEIVGDSDDCWWYFWDETLQPPDYNGVWGLPSNPANNKNIMFKVEVYESQSTNEINGQNLYEIGIIAQDEYLILTPQLDMSCIDNLKTDFTSNNYECLFDLRGKDICQWSIYGERRSRYDIGGDLADIIFIYSYGEQELIKLYYDEWYYYLDRDRIDDNHFNDDMTDFQSKNLDYCTEAEGNDESEIDKYLVETQGSDGLDFDCEWIFFFADEVLQGHGQPHAGNNDFQTLLWHGVHAIFGFYGDIDETSASFKIMVEDLFSYWWGGPGDPSEKVIDGFIQSCTANNIQDFIYYYHASNADDFLWGAPGSGKVTPDVLRRDDIAYDKYV